MNACIQVRKPGDDSFCFIWVLEVELALPGVEVVELGFIFSEVFEKAVVFALVNAQIRILNWRLSEGNFVTAFDKMSFGQECNALVLIWMRGQ